MQCNIHRYVLADVTVAINDMLDCCAVVKPGQNVVILAAMGGLHGGRNLVLVSSNTLAPKGSAESQAKSKQHAEDLRAYTPSYENMLKLTRGTLYHQELVSEELVRERYEMSTGKNYQAQIARAHAPRPKSLDDELANIKAKTLILWGRNDHGTSLDQALLLLEKIPGAELHIFDQCAHWVQWDRAERFNSLVSDFLKGDS